MHIATNDPAMTETVRWQSVEEIWPDDDELVLLCLPDSDDEPVWPGYWNGMAWMLAEGGECDPSHWAYMPSGPTF